MVTDSLNDENRVEFLSLVAQSSEIIQINSGINDCVGQKDNQFLELAVDARASIILNGNSHQQI